MKIIKKMNIAGIAFAFLTIILLMPSNLAVKAAKEEDKRNDETMPFDITQIINIPFFMVNSYRDLSGDELSAIHNSIHVLFEEREKLCDSNMRHDRLYNMANELNRIGVIQLSESDLLYFANNPLISHTLANTQRLLEEGLEIHFVTLNMPTQANNFYGISMGRHNGFEFRFWDGSRMAVGTRDWVPAGNGMSWSQFGWATADFTADVLGNASGGWFGAVAGGTSRVFGIIGTIRSFVEAFHNNADIIVHTHGPGLRSRLMGDLKNRVILIEDRNNRDPRNNFVIIGSLDSLTGNLQLEISFFETVSWAATPVLRNVVRNSQFFDVLTPNWTTNIQSRPALANELILRYHWTTNLNNNIYHEWVNTRALFEAIRP